MISNLGMAAAIVVLLAMTGLILTEIVLRTYFDSSTYAADELVGYGIGAMSFLALGQSLDRGTLIRMNLLISALNPKSFARSAIEFLCVLFALGSGGTAFFFFLRNVVRNYQRGYTSETMAQVPLWLPEAFIVVGLGIFLLQLISYLLRVATGSVDYSMERASELGHE